MPGSIAAPAALKVSVCVISFNHEAYIAKCLDSIVNQKTGFEFEVIVRDDGSADNTSALIKRYSDKYPTIFRVLDGSKNLGAVANLLATLSHARGAYVAICEGDDYWIDDLKLEKQAAALDQDPRCSFTAHPCRIHDEYGLGQIEFFKSSGSIRFDAGDILKVAGQFAPTASYMFRREIIETFPDWFLHGPVADFLVEMYAVAYGYGLYLPDVMCAYRRNVTNSWSSLHGLTQTENTSEYLLQMIACLDRLKSNSTFTNLDFSIKRASCNFLLSVVYLLSRNFAQFARFISLSYEDCSSLSRKQYILYKTRSVPPLAYFLCRLFNSVRRSFSIASRP